MPRQSPIKPILAYSVWVLHGVVSWCTHTHVTYHTLTRSSKHTQLQEGLRLRLVLPNVTCWEVLHWSQNRPIAARLPSTSSGDTKVFRLQNVDNKRTSFVSWLMLICYQAQEVEGYCIVLEERKKRQELQYIRLCRKDNGFDLTWRCQDCNDREIIVPGYWSGKKSSYTKSAKTFFKAVK